MKNKGIALFEVLVAAAVLSAACLLLSRSLARSVRSIYAAQDRYRADLLLEGVLWEAGHSASQGPPPAWPAADFLKDARWSWARRTAWKDNLDQFEIDLSWSAGRLTLSDYAVRP